MDDTVKDKHELTEGRRRDRNHIRRWEFKNEVDRFERIQEKELHGRPIW